MRIRSERKKDHDAVAALLTAAFASPKEAALVSALRKSARPLVSMVFEEEGEVIGHILFSPVNLADQPAQIIMALGPMAVRPDSQRRGIGKALVSAGLDECHRVGVGAVVVLGHPEYYPRFGFRLANQFGIKSNFDVPSEAFMAIELQPGYLRSAAGKVEYHEAFNAF